MVSVRVAYAHAWLLRIISAGARWAAVEVRAHTSTRESPDPTQMASPAVNDLSVIRVIRVIILGL